MDEFGLRRGRTKTLRRTRTRFQRTKTNRCVLIVNTYNLYDNLLFTVLQLMIWTFSKRYCVPVCRVTEVLVGMGYSRAEIEESLSQAKYDDIFATYLLLGRKNNDVSMRLV